MKTTYVYFGQKGYFNTPGVAITSNIATLATFAKDTAGLLPPTKANSVSPSTLAYRVVHVAGDAVTDVRGTDYTNDFVTGELFSSATAWGADLNQDDKQIGQVTELTSASAYIAGSADGVIKVGDNTATGGAVGSDAASGFIMTTADTVIIEQTKAGDTAGNGYGGVGGAFAYPMSRFLGANPVAYAKTHYDGTVLDQTDLYFESQDGVGGSAIIRLIHTAGKYPEIVKTMEALENCGIYDRAVTFYDLDINGKETFLGGSTLSGNNDLGIVGCWRTA